MNRATAAAAGYSDSNWSVWASSIGAVATTAVTPSAMTRPARRRMIPWTSTNQAQNAATSTSLSRS
jgi:hypothetical protein